MAPAPPSSVPLGDLLRSLRDEARLTLPSVARVTGYGLSTLYKYEAGRTRPPTERLDALLDLYGLPRGERLEVYELHAAWRRR